MLPSGVLYFGEGGPGGSRSPGWSNRSSARSKYSNWRTNTGTQLPRGRATWKCAPCRSTPLSSIWATF